MMRLGKISAIDRFSGLATITDANAQEIDFRIADSPFELYINRDVWFEIVLTAKGLKAVGLRSLSLAVSEQIEEPCRV